MKYIFLFLQFIIGDMSFSQITMYSVKGHINGEYKGKIYMFLNGEFKKGANQESLIVNGDYYFTGITQLPVLARFYIGDQISYIGDAFLDKENTTINCSNYFNITNGGYDTINEFKIESVEGSHSQELINEFNNKLNKIRSNTYDSFQMNNLYFKELFRFCLKYRNSKMSPYLIGQASELNYIQLDSLRNILDTNLTNTYEYRYMLKGIDHVMKDERMIGSKFFETLFEDTTGRKVKIDFRNKYNLILFWASWCVPCRREHEYLKRLYSDYKKKGLFIISISLDKNIQNWKSAILADGLTWLQMIDLRSFDGELAKYYAIDAIPYNILLDSTGNIINKNLSIIKIDSLMKLNLK